MRISPTDYEPIWIGNDTWVLQHGADRVMQADGSYMTFPDRSAAIEYRKGLEETFKSTHMPPIFYDIDTEGPTESLKVQYCDCGSFEGAASCTCLPLSGGQAIAYASDLKFIDDGAKRTFSTGATRDTAIDKEEPLGFNSALADRAFNAYMHKHRVMADGSLRASDNWKFGFDENVCIHSLSRHYEDLRLIHEGYASQARDQDVVEVLCAMRFNINAMLRDELVRRLKGGGSNVETVSAKDSPHSTQRERAKLVIFVPGRGLVTSSALMAAADVLVDEAGHIVKYRSESSPPHRAFDLSSAAGVQELLAWINAEEGATDD